MNTAIVEYKEVAMVLADLASKYKGVLYDVSTAEGMSAAKAGKKEIATYRIALEKTRVSLKEESLKRGRLIDSEAKPIAAALAALEDPIEAQIKADERRKEAEFLRLAEEQAAKIAAEEAAKKAAEEAKLAAERTELAKERAALEATAREARLKIEEEQRASRMKMEEEERAARKLREVEEARIKQEREAAEVVRRAAEEATRKLREAEEAKAREEQRLKDELLGGKQMLDTFVQRFGKRKEFEQISGLIAHFLEGNK